MESSTESNLELETFREQWRAEVRARHPVPAAPAPAPAQASLSATTQESFPSQSHPPLAAPAPALATTPSAAAGAGGGATGPRRPPPPPTKKPLAQDRLDDEYIQPRAFDEPATSSLSTTYRDVVVIAAKETPVTALDHYEKAVENEAAGRLGESLRLYRKAFRMDEAVDQEYRVKHFPRQAPKQSGEGRVEGKGDGKGDGKGKGGGSGKGEGKDGDGPMTMRELIASFAGLGIEAAPPPVEGMEQPRCFLGELPEEILVQILGEVAGEDVGDFVRLGRVCKRLAFLVATEDRIWRRICLGKEFGFGGMHYRWQRQVSWGKLTEEETLREEEEGEEGEEDREGEVVWVVGEQQRAQRQAEEGRAATLAFYRSLYGSSWQRMFRLRPRIRFNGCYISTNNYIRPGMANANTITWNSPVHIVTYYRFLRFFRDGTVLSLQTTADPADVVHHLTRDKVALHKGGAQPHLPSIVVQSALRGRWRLASARDNPHASISEVEGDVVVETEGVSNYIYRLDLSLRSAGKGVGGTRNNKFVWRGFYSYDRLRDDWAEFGLKNDKPFFFSRVRSYGLGE